MRKFHNYVFALALALCVASCGGDSDDDDDDWMDMTIRFDGKQMRAYADYIDKENNITFHAYSVSTFTAKY